MPRANADVVPIRPQTPALPDTAVADGYHPGLPLSQIDPNPANVRRELGDLDELIESIRAVGVRHPITVTPVNHIGDNVPNWIVIDGHRRYAAAERVGLTTIPAIIRTDISSAADVITEMLRAGLLQERLSPIEEAAAYVQLELLGLSAGDIAKRVGRSRSTVEQRLHLMDLPESVRERVHTRTITLDEAAAIAEFEALTDQWKPAKEWVKRLLGSAGDRDFAYQLSSARSAWNGEQQRRTSRTLARELGYRQLTRAELPEQSWGYGLSEKWLKPELRDGLRAPGADYWSELARAHAGCPGAAYLEVGYGHGVDWYCLQPELHDDPAAPSVDDPVDEPLGAGGNAVPYAEEDPKAAQDELFRAWQQAVRRPQADAAADVRRAWIRGVLLPGRKALTAAQASAVARYTGLQLARYLIDLDGDTWLTWAARYAGGSEVDGLTEAEVEEELTRRLRDGDPMRTLLAGLASQAEGTAAYTVDRDWLSLLQALGYQPCSWEEQAVAPVTGICRTCLCTADAACEDGLSPCWWVMPGVDLCSRCARAEVAATTTDG